MRRWTATRCSRTCRTNPRHRRIPVIIITSEKLRAEACLRNGAKPTCQSPSGRRTCCRCRAVPKTPGPRHRGERRGALVTVGKIELGLPWTAFTRLAPRTATQPLALGPSYLTQMIELHGEPVAVLDLRAAWGVEHAQPLLERKLVVVEREGARMALCVDEVRDPEELPPPTFIPRERLAARSTERSRMPCWAGEDGARGVLLIDPRALVSRELLRKARLRPARRGGAMRRYATTSWTS